MRQHAEAATARADQARSEAETANEKTEKTLAEYSRDQALAAKKSADELIGLMHYDLSDKLSKAGRLDMMKAINDRIARYHQDHPPEQLMSEGRWTP